MKYGNFKLGITQYEYEDDLFYTHIGTLDMELYLSVWGKTEEESIQRATDLLIILGK